MNQNILLLSCCAPCSCAVIKTLAEEKKKFSVVFYNPNIRPFEEYEKRKEENKKVCKIYGINFIELEYETIVGAKKLKDLKTNLNVANAAQYAFICA